MDNSKLGRSQYIWIIALCTASVLCSLAAHLTADVAGAPPELAGLLTHGRTAGGEHTTMCDLLEEIALLAIAVAINLPLLAFLSNGLNLTLRDWVLPPPVRPPTAIC
jgi:hypothetical protein